MCANSGHVQTLIIILRVLHILFGIFWAGTTFFSVLILEPRLRKMGPSFQNPVMKALMSLITPLMMLSSVIVIGSGITLMLMQWSSLSTILSTVTGWFLFIGFVSTIAAAIVGFGILTPTGMRFGKFIESIQGTPDAEQQNKIKKFGSKIETFSRLNFIFILIASLTMALIRYI